MTPANRPPSPGSDTAISQTIRPQDLDPELAAMAMAKDLMLGLDKPSDISKIFAVRKSIAHALNHTDENKTGMDTSLRLALYDSYEKSSLNIDAKLFNSFMAFLMKPKMIIQGLPTGVQQQQEPGFLSRMISGLTGRGKPNEPQQVKQ